MVKCIFIYGPTSANRDKVAIGFKEPGVQLNKANTYTYGKSPLISTLNGATLDDFISSASKSWLQGTMKWNSDASITDQPSTVLQLCIHQIKLILE